MTADGARPCPSPPPDEPTPGLRRKAIIGGLTLVVTAVALYVLLPRIAGLDDTWRRLSRGEPAWLVAGAVLEFGSYAGYVVLFGAVMAAPPARLRWRDSALITLAGVAATRMLALGGAGGIAVTAWALRRHGLSRHAVGQRMTAFMVLLYAVFMSALLAGGIGLRTGVLAGGTAFGLTVVPAVFSGVVILAALALGLVPHHLSWTGRVSGWLAGAMSTVGDGVRGALTLARTRDPRLAGALAWWAFDVAVLWACLRAFGGAPPVGVIVMAYFVGMLGNLLPLPGGVGGVEGGMIGALIGFDVAGGLAIAGVLAYRAFAFWLPTIPGIAAYFVLLRRARVEP